MGCLTILSDYNTSSPNPLFIKLAHTISDVLCTPAESRARNQHPIANLSRIPPDKFTNPRMHSIFAPAFGSELWDNNATKSESKPMEERISGNSVEIGSWMPEARILFENSEQASRRGQHNLNTVPNGGSKTLNPAVVVTCDFYDFHNLPWYKTQFCF
jgi:hypothetical protein